MRSGVSTFNLYVAALCLLAATAGAQSDISDAEQAELARQESFRSGMVAIVDDLNRQSFDRFVDSIDQEALIDAIYGLRLIDQQVKKQFNENLEYSWESMVTGSYRAQEEAPRFRLLGVESRRNLGRAVIRIDLPNFQFNYHEFDLRLTDKGRVLITDWMDYLQGKRFSDDVGDSLVMAAPSNSAMRKMLDFRNVTEQELFRFGELLKAVRDRQLPRYLEILADIGERFQRQRIVVESTVHLARTVRKRREMIAGLRTMASYYPDEPLYSLMLLDYYFPSRKYQEANSALLMTYRKLGFDDSAMEARLSSAALVLGNAQDAAAHANRALELEPGLELGWWSALSAYVALGDFRGAVEALTALERQFGYELDAESLGKNAAYRDLLSSAEFQEWLSAK
jgi:tetratricopeptide (TPR) repeat protein